MAYCINTAIHGATYFSWDDAPPNAVLLGLSCNFPFSVEQLPNSATRLRGKQLPDVFSLGGCNAVNARFRDLVERYEPGIHLFHPITLKEKDGTKIESQYYIFCARQALDFVLIAQSGMEWRDNGRDYPPHTTIHTGNWETHHPSHKKSRAASERKHGILKSTEERGFSVYWPRHLKVSGPAVSGRHLWTGDRVSGMDLWVSDDFFAAIEKARIKCLTSSHYGFETQELWVAEVEMAPVAEWLAKHAH